jgi:glucose/arabinose dehydrogenase
MVRRRTHRPTTPTARVGALVLAAVVALSMITSPVGLVGTASAQAATPVFDKSTLQGFPSTANNPTALEFGPDGRLYVATQGGTVYALTVERAGSNSYQVVDQETITAIKAIPNHDDFGTYVPGTTNRQITGLATGGTAAQPVVYIASSDPEIDVGQDDDDTDTNSGAISRLTLTYNGGQLVDVNHDVLVLGLPRSEENHATNGLDLSADGTTLYAAQGGNTNKGAPSDKFGHTPEFALSAAVLEIDLAAIEADYPAKTLARPAPRTPTRTSPSTTPSPRSARTTPPTVTTCPSAAKTAPTWPSWSWADRSRCTRRATGTLTTWS